MFEILAMVAGATLYNAFKSSDERNVDSIENIEECSDILSNEEITFNYFMNLRLDEQEKYYNDNLDLRYYKDDNSCGLTNDRYFNAKHAQEISRKTGKIFDNKYRTY